MFNRQYGYLFLINDNIEDTLTFMHYINEGSYVAERKPLDLDPYRDANGVLHRNVVDNVPIMFHLTLGADFLTLRWKDCGEQLYETVM